MNELKTEDVKKALEELLKELGQTKGAHKPYFTVRNALALLREKDARIEELKMELDDCVKLWNDEKKFLENEINEKDAEIERLQARQENVSFVLKSAMEHYDALYEQAKEILKAEARAEAITEFAERAKRRLPIVSPSVFDKIAKEMKGEAE